VPVSAAPQRVADARERFGAPGLDGLGAHAIPARDPVHRRLAAQQLQHGLGALGHGAPTGSTATTLS
jgi:hypothetical protein